MDRRIAGVAAAAAAVAVSAALLALPGPGAPGPDPGLGLVINAPQQEVSLRELGDAYADAALAGAGRSNVYMFWNIVEPEQGRFDWGQYDVLMGLNERHGMAVTLYFSVVNGATLGPFPDWMGGPTLGSVGEDRLAAVLDAVLSRYHVVDSVIIAGEAESQFRYSKHEIPAYRELFEGVRERLAERHPGVAFGNSFGLHHVINKGLEDIVAELAVGDFVAFSYFPVDSLNDIARTPAGAAGDLARALDLARPLPAAFFEVGWSTSGFVGGDEESQAGFVGEVFSLYRGGEVEFVTWYRQHDRPEGTCAPGTGDVGGQVIEVGGGSGLGGSDHVIERLGHYLCESGLVRTDGTPKPAWAEFREQAELSGR